MGPDKWRIIEYSGLVDSICMDQFLLSNLFLLPSENVL